MYSFREQLDVYEHTPVSKGPLGEVKEWAFRESIPAIQRLESLEGRAKHQQIGHSAAKKSFVVRGPAELTINERLKCGNQWYAIEEPPGNPDGLGRLVTIYVREIEEPSS